MRLPSTFFEPSFSLSLLRTTPARKPRTECCCQPVAFIIAAMVAPAGDSSIAITRDCFDPGWRLRPLSLPAVDCPELAAGAVVAAGLGPAAGVADCAIADFFADADFADLDIEILHSVDGGVVPPPPKPHLGNQAGGAGSQSALGARNCGQYRSNRGRMPVLSG